jgi:hypothetical protein
MIRLYRVRRRYRCAASSVAVAFPTAPSEVRGKPAAVEPRRVKVEPMDEDRRVTMRPRRLPLSGAMALVILGAGALAGCAGGGGPAPGATTTPPSTTANSSVGTLAPPPASTEPPSTAVEFRITYDWAVPSTQVTINHTVNPPIAPLPAPPLPYLVGIYAGDHPSDSPAYQRMSFYFRGAFPSYNLQYVSSVLSEGQGTPVPLQGNAFLRVGFVEAQAHDNSGASTIVTSPKNPLGYPTLKSYAAAGDFEGHVTYGLGLQVASGSDQALKIRAGELKKPDSSGGFFYVIFVDVRRS